MQRENLANNEIYHVYNRGVEKRKIFLNDIDCVRFVHDLFEFNDQNPVLNVNYHFPRKSMEVGLQYIERKPRNMLVEILVFCLMPNHFHLMLKQKADNGVTEFMRKLGTGYTNYFNKKYDRVGSLFQGKYKSAHVAKEQHFIHLPYYIHLNPLSLLLKNSKDDKSMDHEKIISFLKSYRWSSHLDYTGEKNFPSVTQREFLLDFFGGTKGYNSDIMKWIGDVNFKEIQHLTLEK